MWKDEKAEEDEKIAGFDWSLASDGMTVLFATTEEVDGTALADEMEELALRRIPKALPPLKALSRKAEVEEPLSWAVEEDACAPDVDGFELKDENATPLPNAGVVDLSRVLLELAAS